MLRAVQRLTPQVWLARARFAAQAVPTLQVSKTDTYIHFPKVAQPGKGYQNKRPFTPKSRSVTSDVGIPSIQIATKSTETVAEAPSRGTVVTSEPALPRITVVGVGGAGCNALNNMIAGGLSGVQFVAANTDLQSLNSSLSKTRVQLGKQLTLGLGAGARPDVGRLSGEESAQELRNALHGSNMVFVTAGMGGGTGTGAAPVIASIARDMGILTVGVVSTPFAFEGRNRMRLAASGLEQLERAVDTLIIVPNQNLFAVAQASTTLKESFRLADNVLLEGVKGVTDLILLPGLINLDFADVCTVMQGMGRAVMGTGEGSGADKATQAAKAALANPLLSDSSIKGARGVLINITGGPDLALYDVDEIANTVRAEVAEDAAIIFGTVTDMAMSDRVRVCVIAAGLPNPSNTTTATAATTTTDSTTTKTTTTSAARASATRKPAATITSTSTSSTSARAPVGLGTQMSSPVRTTSASHHHQTNTSQAASPTAPEQTSGPLSRLWNKVSKHW